MSGNMERVLRLMAEKKASDVYLSANTPILIKINGQMLQLSDQPLHARRSRASCWPRCSRRSQLEELDDTGELNIGVGLSPASAASASRAFTPARHRSPP